MLKIMPMDFLTGKLTPSAYKVPQDQTRYEQTVRDLGYGENGFTDFEALWVDPKTQGLYLDTDYSFFTPEQFDELGLDETDYARVVNFLGSFVVDILHLRDTTATTESGLVTFIAPTFEEARRCKEHSRPVAGLIQDEVTLDLFNQLLLEQYGAEAVLADL
jgi:hypothetical protein